MVVISEKRYLLHSCVKSKPELYDGGNNLCERRDLYNDHVPKAKKNSPILQ